MDALSVTALAVTVAEVVLGVVGLEKAKITVDRGVRNGNFIGTVGRGVGALAEATGPVAERRK